MLDTELCWWCGCLKSVKSPLMANLDIYVLFSALLISRKVQVCSVCVAVAHEVEQVIR